MKRQPSPAIVCLKQDPQFLDKLTEVERFVLPYVADFWMRPDQHVPRHDFTYCGFICGRGFGKSWAIAQEINRRVQSGEARSIALMMQTEPRVYEVMVDFLIATSPPWFKAELRGGAVHWPNGAVALVFTAEAPEAPRGGNFDLTWLGELVAWPSSTRKAAFDNITTATRKGKGQVLWDTTSKGKNELIIDLLKLHEENPHEYPIIRGTVFSNEWFTIKYLRGEMRKYPKGRRRDEELYGIVYTESAGALWQQVWLDDHRVAHVPLQFRRRLVSLDPTTTHGDDSDVCGFAVGEECGDGHVYITKDRSDKYTPEGWADAAIDECEAGAAGIVIEVTGNSGGHYLLPNIRARAALRKSPQFPEGLQVREWPDSNGKPFPDRTPGVIYVREKKARDAKETRAYAPAGLSESGFLHLVGHFAELELEMTTWVPGDRKSPNRLDAAVYLALELAGLELTQKPDAKKQLEGVKKAHAVLGRMMHEKKGVPQFGTNRPRPGRRGL